MSVLTSTFKTTAMKKTTTIYISLVCVLLYSLTSCRKFVTIPPPKNQLTAATVFADSTDANAAVLGIYENMMETGGAAIGSGGTTIYPGLSADEIYPSSTDATINQFYKNQLQPANNNNQSFYVYAYKYIYLTNACMEGLATSSGVSAATVTSLTAEAKFLRAFLYFNLLNLYGGVPLILGTDYEQNRLIARSPADVVYAQLINDLKFAQSNLPPFTTGSGRANTYAATALLAKIYLYTGQYALAATEADKIINSGNYTLETNLSTVFLASSKETVWNMLPVSPSRGSWDAYNFVPSSTTAKPKYILTTTLYNAFETDDLRKTFWTKANTVAGQVYPYPFKYKIALPAGTPTEYNIIYRLAEIYLIRSEARTNNNDLPGAIADLNLVRKRAGLANTPATDKGPLLLAIEKERQVELFCEWGNRWMDLKRTGRANTILGTKPNWLSTSVLYPVPLSEQNANPNLTQNPGYQN